MKLLLAGVIIFSLVHLVPAGAVKFRTSLIGRLGENAYKGIFALLLIAAVVMMVLGWKATEASEVYLAPQWGGVASFVLMLAMSVLFFAPYMPNSIRRAIRHPQLLGVVLFGIGHLAAVGNLRSIVLFGGLAAWAVIEIVLLNRRDGAWTKPESVPLKSDLKLLVAGLGFFLIFLFSHQGLFGTSLLP